MKINISVKKAIFIALCLGLVTVFNSTLKAQAFNQEFGEVVMPSYNVQALGEYVDVPVNGFSGLPSINIPLYQLQHGPIGINVNLSYHASGIVLSSLASNVGLGWALNAGGMISRTVRGIKDESHYLSSSWELPLINATNISAVSSGFIDAEPDIFSFNFNGYSGKFIFIKDENNMPEVFLMPRQDIKIILNWTGGDIGGFTIITPDGTIYTFGGLDASSNPAFEKLYSEGAQGDPASYVSSWLLKKIESYDHNYEINLSYENESYSYYQRSTCYTSNITCEGTGNTYSKCNGDPNSEMGGMWVRKMDIEGIRLNKITSDVGTIDFIYGDQRKDLISYGVNPPLELESVSLSWGGHKSNSFKFNYDYYKDTKSIFQDNPVLYRLRLSSLERHSSTGFDHSYSFDYYKYKNEDDLYMPHRLSSAIDHWGYFNGEYGNPNNYIYPTTIIGLDPVGRSNRNVSLLASRTGTLSKITYPTGGTRTFDFESHQYFGGGISSPTIEQKEVKMLSCTGGNTESDAECCGGVTTEYNENEYSVTFNSQSELNSLFYNICMKVNLSCPGAPIEGEFIVSVYDPIDPVNTLQQIVNEGAFENQPQSALCPSFDNFLVAREYGLEIGREYIFKLQSKNVFGSFDLYYVDYGTVHIISNYAAGGLRIKKMVASDGEKDIVRSYTYTSESGSSSGSSSGILSAKPIYNLSPGSYVTDLPPTPLSSINGYHIGYSRVLENYNGAGSKIYQFNNNFLSVPPSISPLPLPYTHGQGELIKSSTLREGVEVSSTEIIPKTSAYTLTPEYWTTAPLSLSAISGSCGGGG